MSTTKADFTRETVAGTADQAAGGLAAMPDLTHADDAITSIFPLKPAKIVPGRHLYPVAVRAIRLISLSAPSAMPSRDLQNDEKLSQMLLQREGLVMLGSGRKPRRSLGVENAVIIGIDRKDAVVAPGHQRHCPATDGYNLQL